MHWLESIATYERVLHNADSMFCNHKRSVFPVWNDGECTYNRILLALSKRPRSTEHIIHPTGRYRPDHA